MRSHRTLSALLLAFAACFYSCGKAEPVTRSHDATGPRLAVLSPALAITLRDLGREESIVARHGWDMATDASVPVAGDQRGVDYEVLLSVDPDVVVMEAGATPTPPRLAELASQRGWRIVRLAMLSLTDVRRAIIEMDQLTIHDGEPPSAQARSLLDRLDAATSPREGLADRAGRVVMMVSAGPPGVLGPGSFHYEIGQAIGLEMLPHDGAAFISMGLEELRSLEPDTIVLIVPGSEPADLASLVDPMRGIGIRAVEEARVVLISDPEALTPSTAMIGFAESLTLRVGELPPIRGQPSK